MAERGDKVLAESREKMEKTAAAFAEWRRNRRGRSAIPEGLWRRAVARAREAGIFRTARDLRLNYEALKERLRGGMQSTGRDGLGRDRCKPKPNGDTGFIEMPAGIIGRQAEWELEIEDRSGKRMRIISRSNGRLNAAALSRMFLGRRR